MTYTFYLPYPERDLSIIALALRDKKKRISISLGISIDTENWNKDESRVSPKAKDSRFINAKIAEAERVIKRAIKYNELENLSIEEVANMFRKDMGMEIKENKPKEGLFLPFYQMWATTSFGKHKATRQTLYHYRIFKDFIGRLEPTFNDIDYNLYVKFLSYLQNNGYKPNMQGLFVRSIKAAMNEAYKRELHNNRAYQNFEKPTEQVTTVALTTAEVDMIYNAKLSGSYEKARDLFIIGCYTGMRFSDYSRLTAEDADREFITKIQQKTKNEVCIPVHPRVKAILKKWGGSPDISQQKVNALIKTICAQLGINTMIEVQDDDKIIQKPKWEMISTHTARRTAATNLLLSGASIYEVQKFLGHNAVRQTETYLRISARESAKLIAKNKFFTEE